jgi:hypothetical protein
MSSKNTSNNGLLGYLFGINDYFAKQKSKAMLIFLNHKIPLIFLLFSSVSILVTSYLNVNCIKNSYCFYGQVILLLGSFFYHLVILLKMQLQLIERTIWKVVLFIPIIFMILFVLYFSYLTTYDKFPMGFAVMATFLPIHSLSIWGAFFALRAKFVNSWIKYFAAGFIISLIFRLFLLISGFGVYLHNRHTDIRHTCEQKCPWSPHRAHHDKQHQEDKKSNNYNKIKSNDKKNKV